MSEEQTSAPEKRGRPSSPPVFNLPGVVIALVLVFVAVHLLIEQFAGPYEQRQIFALFAFWPLRYEFSLFAQEGWPGGTASAIWSFVSYSFLHGSWGHLLVNCFWMAAFGGALAWRFGAMRFLLFSGLSAIGGALLFLLMNQGASIPMIGASAAISGQVAGVMRFGFCYGGPMHQVRAPGRIKFFVPAFSLMRTFQDRRTLGFLGIWGTLNVVFGLLSPSAGGPAIAWEAHLGGFATGLLLFSLFDRATSQSN
ncbi:rhomboid family intramembrane serine protease [Polycladidibacter hongkongensis]|uniref:rhomboid family intramembrane serine protease n=1 Tax=Polycladidibacter hongkongensis TaxID=1647556 RepID=UPI00082EF402|nr:rhomboid family intramembrane serine protease [Pseudovibrio hongkongensis]